MAALLALAFKHFGTLDIAGKYPADAILGALLFALSVKNAGEPEGYAGDLRALSQSCTDVFVFRKLSGIDSGKPETKQLSGASASKRAANEDPLIEAGRKLGL